MDSMDAIASNKFDSSLITSIGIIGLISVAMARLGPLTAQLRVLSRYI